MDTLFLRRCLALLTPGPDEELMIISGPKVEGRCTPLLCYRLKYQYSSAVRVAADPESTIKTLRHLEKNGHKLLCAFHSHPGRGQGAVRESSTDIAAQERFESAGFESITGIFSRDGYVRFCANRISFCLETYGNGVEEVDDHVFLLRKP
jgi:hypothetical protein